MEKGIKGAIAGQVHRRRCSSAGHVERLQGDCPDFHSRCWQKKNRKRRGGAVSARRHAATTRPKSKQKGKIIITAGGGHELPNQRSIDDWHRQAAGPRRYTAAQNRGEARRS